MAQARCGQIFSWDTPMWCKGDKDYCKSCPLYIGHKKDKL